MIYSLSKPTTITVTITEGADLAVTSVSFPPALLTTTKESRTEAQRWGLKLYSILVGDDYQDILFDEDVSLHLVITPSTAEHLSITWTELYTVLGDTLLDAKKVVIECSKPERLARLFMLPEAEFVGIGQSCVERGMFGSEIISSDRETREALRSDVSVFVEEEEYKLVEEKVGSFFGLGQSFLTKGFVKRSPSEEAGALYFQDAAVELEAETAGDNAEAQSEKGEELTEGALERFCVEVEKLFPGKSCLPKSDPGGSIMPDDDQL